MRIFLVLIGNGVMKVTVDLFMDIQGHLLWFKAKKFDENGFVVDFSSLKPEEKRLKQQFDHTFLVNKDDPLLDYWENLHKLEALDLRIMDNVGMEGSSELIWKWANEYLQGKDKGRTCCWKTESKENQSNKACYEKFPDWFKF